MACEQIHGYITVLYDLSWWLGYTVSKDVEKKEVTVTFLHPKGPATSFSYPDRADILTVPFMDVLTAVDVSTDTGRIYKLNINDQKKSSDLLEKKFK